jgi:Cd(II)/Pb(II)-responsive transcriptional regulator
MTLTHFRIGELATAGGCQVETIRYYEREGLLPAPSRSAGNYRMYGGEHVHRLVFIRHCRSLDMPLADVRRLLHFKDAPEENCSEVNVLLDTHIAQIRERIEELKNLQDQMSALRSYCSQTQSAKDCGILQGLSVAKTDG